jgi:hypothetical protein
MTPSCLMAAALALTIPMTRRLGALLSAGGRRPEYTLADLADCPAILLRMRNDGADRRSLELLRDSIASRGEGARAALAADGGPVFYP